jgi:alanine-glyoxylate transaminase / serine-glyoxylate transaminase / serine-pyruvate transaminase
MSPERSFQPPRRVLMGPGPSDVSERVLAALARPTIGHLDPAFVAFMDELKDLLRFAFRTTNELTFPVSGPGTAGMETCVMNLVEPGDEVVVGVNGVFGGRLAEMVGRVGGTPVRVEHAWGRPVDPEQLDAGLREHPKAKLAAFVHGETSTGARSDVRALVEIAHRHGALALVDMVTTLGGCPVEVDGWGIDAAYSGSQKCLSAPPGLSPVTFGPRAIQKIEARRAPVPSWFLDLRLVMAYWGGGAKRTYHHTAPINALYGLHEALLILKEEGLEPAWKRHETHHRALAAGLRALGLDLFVEEGARLWPLNAVGVPAGVDEAMVRRRLLEEHGLEIGAGLGTLAGRIWRIGLMGHSARPDNVVHCLNALETVLGSAPQGPGRAAEDARKVLS